MFCSELQKIPNKTVQFQYSKFSPFSSLIKKEKSDSKVSLKEVVGFIQTNLIKLYIERGDQKAISDFFSTSLNKHQMHIDTDELNAFLSKQKDKTVCNITMALIFENNGKLEKALKYWQNLKNEEKCKKQGC